MLLRRGRGSIGVVEVAESWTTSGTIVCSLGFLDISANNILGCEIGSVGVTAACCLASGGGM